MPMSMCVAWMSPFESESRMAPQLAPFTTVELMPYFLNMPFSWAITIGEQSVSAIIPKRRSLTSGLEGSTRPALADAAGAAEAVSLGFLTRRQCERRRQQRARFENITSSKRRHDLYPSFITSKRDWQIELHDLVFGFLERTVRRHRVRDAGTKPNRIRELEVKAWTDRRMSTCRAYPAESSTPHLVSTALGVLSQR